MKQKEKERKHQANKNKPVTIKQQQQEKSCKQSVLSETLIKANLYTTTYVTTRIDKNKCINIHKGKLGGCVDG